MKKNQILTICIITLLFNKGLIISGFAQNRVGYSVEAKLEGIPDDIQFYLIKTNNDGGADTIARTVSKNEQFAFKGHLPLEGELHFVKMDTSVVKLAPRTNSWIRVLLDRTPISLSGNLKDWPNIKLHGATATTEFDFISSKMEVLIAEGNSRLVAAKKDVPKDKTKIELIEEETMEKLVSVLKSHPNAYATPCMAVKMSGGFSAGQEEEIYNSLSNNIKNSFYGQKLKAVIPNLKIREKVAIGKVIPEFFITDEQGKRKSIIELAKQAKYTLIDFWAYWCKPCREAIPSIKNTYSAFNDKGFNVIGVSTDPNITAWKKALKEENMPWINGIQEGRVSSDIFALVGIPGYVLINNKAEILVMDIISPLKNKSLGSVNGLPVYLNDGKSDLHGDALYKRIESLLGK